MISSALLALLIECCEAGVVSLQAEDIYVISSDYCLPPVITHEDDIRESDYGRTPLLYGFEIRLRLKDKDCPRPRQKPSGYG